MTCENMGGILEKINIRKGGYYENITDSGAR